MTAPCFSGSRAPTVPFFCPTIKTSRPSDSGSRMGEAAKSESGPRSSGQFSDLLNADGAACCWAFIGAQPAIHASSAVACADQRIWPVSILKAIRESVVFAAGEVYEFPEVT